MTAHILFLFCSYSLICLRVAPSKDCFLVSLMFFRCFGYTFAFLIVIVFNTEDNTVKEHIFKNVSVT